MGGGGGQLGLLGGRGRVGYANIGKSLLTDKSYPIKGGGGGLVFVHTPTPRGVYMYICTLYIV